MRALEATVVYTAGISIRVRGMRFKRGALVRVSSPSLIAYLQKTGGFNVTVTKYTAEKQIARVRRTAFSDIAQVSQAASEPAQVATAQVATPVRKTGKKKKVRRTKKATKKPAK